MNDALNALRSGIAAAFEGVDRYPERWTDVARTNAMLKRVIRDHGTAGVTVRRSSIVEAIIRYRKTRAICTFRDLKYICLGMGITDADGWCVFRDTELRRTVLSQASTQDQLHRRLRCFQVLMSSYWAFPVHQHSPDDGVRQGWLELRSWLFAEQGSLRALVTAPIPWIAAVARHVNLFTDDACRSMGAALLRGDSSELNDAVESLSIPEGSWVFEETVLAQVKASAARSDAEFKALLPRMLTLVLGDGGLRTGELLRARGVAMLVSRYSRCSDRPEHPQLRTAAITAIGNPWLRRASWDARVVNENGKPDERAREMVNSWLRRRLISDFFTILAAAGAGDPRRLDYWLRFEPLIDDMWFALGSDAQHKRSPELREFRESASGRLLNLRDASSDNNAFMMRIGAHLVVEFGASGNACFVFKWDALNENIVNAVESVRSRAEVSLFRLKAPKSCEQTKECAVRLVHQDSTEEKWEQKFDARICPILGRWPAGAPKAATVATSVKVSVAPKVPVVPKASAAPTVPAVTTVPVRTPISATLPSLVSPSFSTARPPSASEWRAFVAANRLSIEDNRAKHGALWVLGKDLPVTVTKYLFAWGFRPRLPRGWFIEDL